MAAGLFKNIHDMKSAVCALSELSLETDYNLGNENDRRAGKYFYLERLWKTLFLHKVIEGHL